jgi:hypothetical protein
MSIRKVITYESYAGDGTYLEIETSTEDITLRKWWANTELDAAMDIGYDQIPELIEMLQEVIKNKAGN